MKRRWKKRKSNTYRTFIISFLLILMLPVTFFTFVFIRYDQKLCEKKILEQAQISLELPMRELEQYVDEFRQIAVQGSLLKYTRKNNLKEYESVKELIKQLSSYQAANSLIQEIAFYNQKLPEEIYTNYGTYSLLYYYQYCVNEDCGNLAEYLETQERGGWVSLAELTMEGRKPEKLLQYVVKQSDGKNWIFTFSSSALSELLEQDGTVTILRDAAGRQLYPYEVIDVENLNSFYQISAVSRDEQLQLIRYLDENVLFTEMSRLKHIFFVTLILVVLSGGWLATTLAFWNDKPIQELRSFCESKVDDIPYMADNFTAIRFTMDRMEQQMQMLQRQREKEHLLLQLLYGKNCDSVSFFNQLHRVGMFQKEGAYQVFLITAAQEELEENWELQLNRILEERPVACEAFMMRYGSGNVVGIVKLKEAQEAVFKNELEQAVKELNKGRKEEITVYIGGRYERPEQVCLSYREVLAGSQQDIVYPRIELDLLYEAIKNKDVDQTCLIIDSLCVHLEEQSMDQKLCSALFCDMVQTIYYAAEELQITDNMLLQLLEITENDLPENYEEMKKHVQKIRSRAVVCLTQMCEKTVSDDTFVNGVLTFIRQNRENKELNVTLVAAHFGISVSNLSHRMKKASGRNVSDYIVEQRMEYAKELLTETDYSVQTIAEMIGYNQSASFVNKFKKSFLVTPLEYRMTSRSGLSE